MSDTAATTGFVRTADADGVRTVRIDRPDVHNAFNEVVIDELTRAFEDAGRDPDVRVIVLASGGPSFSAGADMHWMKRMVDFSREENERDAGTMAAMFATMRDCPKPTIARVHGACFGGGVGLVAACDLAVAVREAVFALTEVKLGILPAVISPYVAERIGAGAMRRYALTAERFDADRAAELGLVSEVVEDAVGLDERIAFFAKLLKKCGPEALAACKATLARMHEAPTWDGKTRVTVESIAERRVSAEGQDGLRAFLEKRPPKWMDG